MSTALKLFPHGYLENLLRDCNKQSESLERTERAPRCKPIWSKTNKTLLASWPIILLRTAIKQMVF